MRIPSIVGVVVVLSLYVIAMVRPAYSWYLFITAEAYSILELFLITMGIDYALLLSLLVIFSIMTFLLLNKLMDTAIFLISLIALSPSIALTYYLYTLLNRVMATYMVILSINTNYFTLMLSSSLSILTLFLITLLLKKVIPALLHHEEK